MNALMQCDAYVGRDKCCWLRFVILVLENLLLSNSASFRVTLGVWLSTCIFVLDSL